jgi:hypothetical protein
VGRRVFEINKTRPELQQVLRQGIRSLFAGIDLLHSLALSAVDPNSAYRTAFSRSLISVLSFSGTDVCLTENNFA